MKIPKIISQVWIGPLDPPVRWMQTWAKLNPDWDYVCFGNEELHNRKWRNQKMIDHYLEECEKVKIKGEFITAQGARFTGEKATLFAWHVMADIMRYELLHEIGGYMPGADSECVAPIPEDAFGEAEIYMVNTGYLFAEHLEKLKEKLKTGEMNDVDIVRMTRYDALSTAPVMASVPKHPFLDVLMKELNKVNKCDMGEAVDTTGNVFMARMLRKYPYKLRGMVMEPHLKEREAIVSGAWHVHHAGTTLNKYRYAR